MVAGAVVPWLVGLWAASRWRGPPWALGAAAAGALLWLAFDFLREAAVSVGLRSPWTLVVLAFFALGWLLPAWLVRRGGAAPGGWTWPPMAWALGVGAHGLGEGFVVGTEAHVVLLGMPPLTALSFVLHKAAEGAAARPLADAPPPRRAYAATALVVALPAALGALLGALLGPTRLPLFAFAAGAGAAAWGALELARRGRGSAAWHAAALAGALALYGAGLLHEV